MKRTIIILLCMGIMIGCGELSSNFSGDLPVANQIDTPYKEPIMFFNDKETYIKDVKVERDYVLLPFIKILSLVGKDWIEDPRFDNYEIWGIEVQGEKYVIDWNKQLFTTLDNYDRTISEKTKQYDLLIELSKELGSSPKELGSSSVSWATREIYLGNEALSQIMKEIGYNVSITWDFVNRTVNVNG